MFERFFNREQTVYVTRDEEEFRRVEAALNAQSLRFRVWTTSEYPVFGWAPWDPRLLARGEKRLRKVFHIDVSSSDRPNLIAANRIVRAVTGRLSNAEPRTEII